MMSCATCSTSAGIGNTEPPALLGVALIARAVGLQGEPLGVRLAVFVPAAAQTAAGRAADDADVSAEPVPRAPASVRLGARGGLESPR